MGVMTAPKTTPGLLDAYDLTERGWWVYPTIGKTPVRNCTACEDNKCGGRHRCTPGNWCHGFHSATNNPDVIERYWPSSESISASVATGPSGLCVLDVDGTDGKVWMHQAKRDGLLVPTLVMRSGSGDGFHIIYRGSVETWDRANGVPVDIKSAGHGTIRWSGIIASDLPVADLPDQLRAKIEKPARPAATPLPQRSSRVPGHPCPTIRENGLPLHYAPSFLENAVRITCEELEKIPAEDGTGRHRLVAKYLAAFRATHGCCATDEDYEAIRLATQACGKPATRGWQNSFPGPSASA